MVELVSGMLSRGVPIHCIGIEQHLTVSAAHERVAVVPATTTVFEARQLQ